LISDGDGTPGPDGDGVLFSIQFRAKTEGNVVVRFEGLGTDAYVVWDNGESSERGFTGLASVDVCDAAGLCSGGSIDLAEVVDATIYVAPAATPFSMFVDCDVATAGVQSSCELPAGEQLVDVDIVLRNASGSVVDVPAFQFDLVTDQTVLDPTGPPVPSFGTTGWNCVLLPPQADSDPDPAVARSSLACFVPSGGGIVLDDGEDVVLARMQYASSASGAAGIEFENVVVPDTEHADADVHAHGNGLADAAIGPVRRRRLRHAAVESPGVHRGRGQLWRTERHFRDQFVRRDRGPDQRGSAYGQMPARDGQQRRRDQ
jgi:hypothetical protein